MCQFFSFISNGQGKYWYMDSKIRKELLKDNPKDYNPDSHTSIAHYYSINEDKMNKFEYNPLTKKFVVIFIARPEESM